MPFIPPASACDAVCASRYIIQEFCDGGSLAQAIDAGVFVDPTSGRNNMVYILQVRMRRSPVFLFFSRRMSCAGRRAHGGKLSPAAPQVAEDIARGMSYIHAANVIHGGACPAPSPPLPPRLPARNPMPLPPRVRLTTAHSPAPLAHLRRPRPRRPEQRQHHAALQPPVAALLPSQGRRLWAQPLPRGARPQPHQQRQAGHALLYRARAALARHHLQGGRHFLLRSAALGERAALLPPCWRRDFPQPLRSGVQQPLWRHR